MLYIQTFFLFKLIEISLLMRLFRMLYKPLLQARAKMAIESNDKVVEMRASFRTEGDETRQLTVRQVMNVNKILGAPTLQDAIEYFKSQVQYVDEVEDFVCFVIDGETYEADFWI